MAQEILGEALAALGVAGCDGFGTGVDMEAAVLPREQVGQAAGADELGFAQGLEEAVSEEFDDGRGAFVGQAVEGAFAVEEPAGGQNMEVRVEDEVVAECVDSGDGGEPSVGQAEAGAEGVAQRVDGGLEEQGEEVAAFAEDAAEHPGDGEDELAVGDLAADGGGDPGAGGADAAHVAGGAEVASLAGEGHQLLVSAVGTLEAGESGGEVATAVEGPDGVGGMGGERTVFLAVVFFVSVEELVPAVVDELPEGRCPGAAGLVDGGHRILYL